MNCPSCNGTGVYQGLNTVEPCRECQTTCFASNEDEFTRAAKKVLSENAELLRRLERNDNGLWVHFDWRDQPEWSQEAGEQYATTRLGHRTWVSEVSFGFSNLSGQWVLDVVDGDGVVETRTFPRGTQIENWNNLKRDVGDILIHGELVHGEVESEVNNLEDILAVPSGTPAYNAWGATSGSAWDEAAINVKRKLYRESLSHLPMDDVPDSVVDEMMRMQTELRRYIDDDAEMLHNTFMATQMRTDRGIRTVYQYITERPYTPAETTSAETGTNTQV